MRRSTTINAAVLTGVRLSADGRRLTLDLRDDADEPVRLSLPADCLNQVISATPRAVTAGGAHRLDSWSLDCSGDELVLTLRSPEAATVSFRLKSWQIEGMATIATHGGAKRPRSVTVH